jgi:hypothetical protein
MTAAVDSLNVAWPPASRSTKLQPRVARRAVMSEVWWDVVGVGENSVDHVLRLPALPSLADATKLEVRSSTHEPGGQVVTTLCTCIAMGLRASYIGAFGRTTTASGCGGRWPRAASTSATAWCGRCRTARR